MRRRRWLIIGQHLPGLADMKVLDLGGTALWWRRAPVKPAHITLINLHEPSENEPGLVAIHGDALRAADLLPNEVFDIVFSNSLIEHLGGHGARRRFADVVTSMAPRYVIQTPYRYFPIEPHWIFPGFQFLPVSARAYLSRKWPLGHTHGWTRLAATNEVMSTELLSLCEMRTYFPDAEIVWERILGVPKSMLAINAGPTTTVKPPRGESTELAGK